MLRVMKTHGQRRMATAKRLMIGAGAMCAATLLTGCRLPADASSSSVASADRATGTMVEGQVVEAASTDGTAPLAPAVRRSVARSAYAGEGGCFDLARDILREEGFVLDRVDAQGGVITTRAKTTAGFATPWHSDQSTASQEVEDLASRQQRTVRITFEAPNGTMFEDLRSAEAAGTESTELTMTVRVIVERMSRPGWRVNTTSVRLSSYCIDTELRDRGMAGQYAVAREDDQDLAERLANEILSRQARIARGLAPVE